MRTLSLSLHQGISSALLYIGVCLAVLLLNPNATYATTLSPALQELEAQRGQTVEASVSVLNTSTADQTYYLDVMNFRASEDGDSPVFIPNDEDASGLVEWIQLASSSVTVPAGSSGDVLFSIVIPNDVASGGYYGALTVSNAPSDVIATNGAIVEAKTASLVLLTVLGETNRQAALLDFGQDDSSLRGFLQGEFSYRVQNQGNVHVLPKGTITFTDLFGRVIDQVDANETESRVLPGTTRRYTVSVDSRVQGWLQTISQQMRVFAFGPVTATLELDYGESVLTAETSFILIPWQLLLSVVGLLAVLWGAFMIGRKQR